ncbi:MAG: hypothetical protein Q7N50_08450 [Armatimonadota bacterium]|nr:hypothetical protein [Armatimonadota bacterium]
MRKLYLVGLTCAGLAIFFVAALISNFLLPTTGPSGAGVVALILAFSAATAIPAWLMLKGFATEWKALHADKKRDSFVFGATGVASLLVGNFRLLAVEARSLGSYLRDVSGNLFLLFGAWCLALGIIALFVSERSRLALLALVTLVACSLGMTFLVKGTW